MLELIELKNSFRRLPPKQLQAELPSSTELGQSAFTGIPMAFTLEELSAILPNREMRKLEAALAAGRIYKAPDNSYCVREASI